MSAEKTLLIVARLADLALVMGEVAAQMQRAALVIQSARDANREITDDEWMDAESVLNEAREYARRSLE